MSPNGNAYQDNHGEADLIRFFWNTPVEVALKYSTGRPVEGRYGESMFFSCVDGRRFFVPVEVGEQINAMGIAPGQLVTITKTEVRDGRKKTAAYKVEPGAVAAQAMAVVPGRPQSSPAPAAAANGQTSPAQSMRRMVYEYYKAAIDVLREAEKYGEAAGLPVKFGAEDVRALAATLIIERRGL